MCTDRANFRSFRSYDYMSAVAAFPDLYFTLFKDLLRFNIVQKCSVALLMVLLNGRHSSELFSKFMESFLIG